MSTYSFGYRNLTSNRNLFSPLAIEAVWQEGTIVSGNDPAVFRKDCCGAWMRRDHYGDTNSEYGWEIDHIFPVSKGGTDILSNLQPLQWENNRGKGDDYPHWSCSIQA